MAEESGSQVQHVGDVFTADETTLVTIKIGGRKWHGTPEEFRSLRSALNEVDFSE